SHSEAQQLASSFQVVASETKPIARLTVAMPMLTAEEASRPDTSVMPPVNIAPQHVPSSGEPLSHPVPDMPRPDGTTEDKPILEGNGLTAGESEQHQPSAPAQENIAGVKNRDLPVAEQLVEPPVVSLDKAHRAVLGNLLE